MLKKNINKKSLVFKKSGKKSATNKKSKKGRKKSNIAFLIFLWDFIVFEIGRKEYSIVPQTLEKKIINFRMENLSFAIPSRLILVLALNFAFFLWLGNGRGLISNEIAEHSKIFIPEVQEVYAAEKVDPPKPPDSGDTFDGYLVNTFSFTRKQCEKSQAEKKNSELCGEDLTDDQTIAQNESFDKEYQKKNAKRIARRPTVLRVSCREKNDHPSYSETKGKHMDEDCCPDPDEWPKPGCIYSAAGYAIMLKGKPH